MCIDQDNGEFWEDFTVFSLKIFPNFVTKSSTPRFQVVAVVVDSGAILTCEGSGDLVFETPSLGC